MEGESCDREFRPIVTDIQQGPRTDGGILKVTLVPLAESMLSMSTAERREMIEELEKATTAEELTR